MTSIRMSLLVVWVFAAWIAGYAQDRPTAVQQNTIYAGADGKFEADPDTAVLQLSISAQEPELKAAYTRAQNSVEQARQALRTNGVDPKQVEVSSFQTMPMYDWKNP